MVRSGTNGTKIRPYVRGRQAFLEPIVFGFCLGVAGGCEAHNVKHVSELQAKQPTADQNEFGKNCEAKAPPTGLTHSFPRRLATEGYTKKKGAAGKELPRRPRRSSSAVGLSTAVGARDDRVLDLDVVSDVCRELLILEPGRTVHISLAPLEAQAGLPEHRERPIR